MLNRKGARWIVVDNDKETLETVSSLLGTLTKAEICPFRSALGALEAFVAAPGIYELVVTDFSMPEMNGVDLRRHLHALDPSLKVFLITGSGLSEETARRSGFCGLLRKPFSLNALKQALETVQSRPIWRTALSAAI